MLFPKSTNLFTTIPSLLQGVLILFISGCSNPAESTRERILVGAIRWDAWHQPTDTVSAGIHGGPVRAVERSLSPKTYQTRAPFFATIVSDTSIRIDGYTQEIVDQEIAYAKAGGLDYWAFLLYQSGTEMSQGLELYLSSKHKADVNFCAIATRRNLNGEKDNPDGIPFLVGLMKEPSYQMVMGNRPLLYFFRPDSSWVESVGGASAARQLVDLLREEARKAGLGDPYIVVMHHKLDLAVSMVDIMGAQALSDYAKWGDGGYMGTPFAELTKVASGYWDDCAATGKEVVPLVTSGWNRLPRIERPVPWESSRQKPGENIEKYFALPTPEQIAAHLQEGCDWINAHPDAAPSRAILIYAWNEHDEGGWLCPTIREDGSPDDSRLKALAKVRR